MLEDSGFGLVEFLASTVVIMSLSAAIFAMLTDVQSTSGYQTEVLSVMENTRMAMNALERYIVQAGNDPLSASFTPVTIHTDDVQLCTDLTGSAGGDQGDPDGDILDADEDVTIRYNANERSLEIVDRNGTVRTLARYISNFLLQSFDGDGNSTTNGPDIQKIRVTISGSSAAANPRTGKTFGMTLASDFTLPNR
jgi:hypothetical protein